MINPFRFLILSISLFVLALFAAQVQAQRTCPAGLAQLTAGIVGPSTIRFGEIVEGHIHIIDPELESGDFLPVVNDLTSAQLAEINARGGLFHGGTVCFSETELLETDWLTGLRTRRNATAALVDHFLVGKPKFAGLAADGLTNRYDMIFVRDRFVDTSLNQLAADAASGASTLEEVVASVLAINQLAGSIVGRSKNVELFGNELFVAGFDTNFERVATLRTDPDIISSIVTPDGVEVEVDENGFAAIFFRDFGTGSLIGRHKSGIESVIASLDFTQVDLDISVNTTCTVGEAIVFDESNVTITGLPDVEGRFTVDLGIDRQAIECEPGNNSAFVRGVASIQPVIDLPIPAARIALQVPAIEIEFIEEFVIQAENPPEPCNALVEEGGDLPETHDIELGQRSGFFAFDYETFNFEDRMLVRYGGQTLFDTGCVGTRGTKTQLIRYGGNSSIVTVEVIPNCAGTTGTAWEFRVNCPHLE